MVLMLALAIQPCAPAQAIVPIVGQLSLPPPTTINAGPGNQMDAHVSGDLVAYTSDDTPSGGQVRYFSFATGVDAGILNQLANGTFVLDFLPDVSGTRIVFTRVGSNTSIQLVDLATGTSPLELDPQASSQRASPGIGGDTTVWVDFLAGMGGEILAFPLPGGPPIPLTANAPTLDRRAAVAEDGSTIVWEQCASSAAPCDIYKAVKAGGAWPVSPVTLTPDDESFSDTNGTVVVYSAARASALGGRDIFWTDLRTGVETQLELDGADLNPSVSGSFILFEHVPAASLFADLFLYDMATNTLYQLTNTPSLSEFLSDISASNRTVRVVWSVLEGSDQNVYGRTVVPDCGNGTVDASEQCDDGNRVNGDCCSDACTLESVGSPCDRDGDRCTPDTCDATGTCVAAPLDPDVCLDDFLCYRTGRKKTLFAPVAGVELTDRFETKTVGFTRIDHLCTPADRNGEGTLDPVTHVQSYQIQQVGHFPRIATVRNDLGELTLTTVTPEFAFVPTAKSLIGPVPPLNRSAHEVDRFKCYKVRVKPGTPPFPRRRVVTVGDQFTSPPKRLILTKPSYLCTPAWSNAEPAKHPDAQLVCYTARPAPGEPRRKSRWPVHTNDEFGPKVLRVFTETDLCIPSTIVSCPRGGFRVEGSCWYLGAFGASCDTTCAAAGGTYDTATESFAGSGGTDANCIAVLNASDHAVPFGGSADCSPLGQGLGCFVLRSVIDLRTGPRVVSGRCATPPTTSSASYSVVDPSGVGSEFARLCACHPAGL